MHLRLRANGKFSQTTRTRPGLGSQNDRRANLAWLALAEAHLKKDQIDQAIESLNTGLTANPHAFHKSFPVRAESPSQLVQNRFALAGVLAFLLFHSCDPAAFLVLKLLRPLNSSYNISFRRD
jgi:hypothetical protein